MKELNKALMVTTAKIKSMKEGESQIFTERPGEPSGNTAHGYAMKINIKIKTEKYFIILLKPLAIINVILMTRLSNSLENCTLSEKLKVTALRLKDLEFNESQIFTERDIKYPGAASQSFATRAGIKIKTEKCLIVDPKTLNTISAIIVTKMK